MKPQANINQHSALRTIMGGQVTSTSMSAATIVMTRLPILVTGIPTKVAAQTNTVSHVGRQQVEGFRNTYSTVVAVITRPIVSMCATSVWAHYQVYAGSGRTASKIAVWVLNKAHATIYQTFSEAAWLLVSVTAWLACSYKLPLPVVLWVSQVLVSVIL